MHTSSYSRMFVVANRLPVAIGRKQMQHSDGSTSTSSFACEQSAGGLVTALLPVMEQTKGVWIGWPGITVTEQEQAVVRSALDAGTTIQCDPVFLSVKEVENFYEGMSNKTIWPLFHSLARFIVIKRTFWESYVQVNQRFSDELLSRLQVDSNAKPESTNPVSESTEASESKSAACTLFIQDYHLMLMPSMLRNALRCSNRASIAFFLHIPFPSFDILRALPWAEEILIGLLGSDLVGFHTQTYTMNFLDAVRHILSNRARVASDHVIFDGRRVQVGTFPLGIPFDRFVKMAELKEPKLLQLIQPVSENASDSSFPRQIILGVDRLDYSKGIPERIKAFKILLETHPEIWEKVSLIQIAVPSRESIGTYVDQKREIDHLIGQINGTFGTSTWQPATYIHKNVDQSTLAILYREAAVCLVTPIRDGMNLVAKEFCACQIEDPGVLILSSLTGAAETMKEALIVNPYDAGAVANMIYRALTMPIEERSARMQALRLREKRYDVSMWISELLAALSKQSIQFDVSSESVASPMELSRSLNGLPQSSRARICVIIGFDGILTELGSVTMDSMTAELLTKLIQHSNVSLVVSSERSLSDMQEKLSSLDQDTFKKILICASRGMEISFSPEKMYASAFALTIWLHPDFADMLICTRKIAEEMHLFQEEYPGCRIEEKGVIVILNFADVDVALHGQVLENASKVIATLGFRPVMINPTSVFAAPPIGWDQAHALHYILRILYGRLWTDAQSIGVIYIGNDEPTMRTFEGLAKTFLVGDAIRISAAQNRLTSLHSVQSLLRLIDETNS